MIKRTFQDIPQGKITEADQQSFLMKLGWSNGASWEDLLHSKRILLVSEAGAGKTFECRSQAEKLWSTGEYAFFVELAALANEGLRDLLDAEEEARLDEWLSSQTELATFFLDSIDELKLTQGSFERALKKFKKQIDGQLHRIRVVITTRPIPFDEQLVRKILPIPSISLVEANEETFAKIAMNECQKRESQTQKEQFPDWRSVALMPLSDGQIIEFCEKQGIDNARALMEDLERRNAQDFARRPQDLIELCADWRVHKRIRTHRDQVATNVRMKLRPRDDRAEPAELSIDKAIEGASRLALAVQVTKRLTIRHNPNADRGLEGAALDPAIILSDWLPDQRKALLERPLFGFASYGRVRFHHRSVAEYLAAERLYVLRKRGMSFRALRRLLFAETKGKLIVRPSKRPIAGWLALYEKWIFELLRDNEPAVLLDEGDPELLSPTQRKYALRAYAERYGPGGWRGLRVPLIQAHRFASSELAGEIKDIWHRGVENPDVREILINLIELGSIHGCSDIVFEIAQDPKTADFERMWALDALVALDDDRLIGLAKEIASSEDIWSNNVARGAIIRLFPKYMSVEQLCLALKRIKHAKRSSSELSWHLPRIISTSSFQGVILEDLRDGLVALVSEGLEWQRAMPSFVSDRRYLRYALAATCELGLDKSLDDKWLQASALALRLHGRDTGNDNAIKSLKDRLANLHGDDNARLFWLEDALLLSLHGAKEPWQRLMNVRGYDGPIQLTVDRDLNWVSNALGDKKRELSARAMLLEAAIRFSPCGMSNDDHFDGLKCLVADEPSLVNRIDVWKMPSKLDKAQRRWDRRQAKREKQEKRRQAKNRASWVQLWREVCHQPELAFSVEQSWNTAWNLWRVMRNTGSAGRLSGWNRNFIEDIFDVKTADRLRDALMRVWRNDQPTLPSERPRAERNTYLTRWILGLAGIYAEAEDTYWADKLSDSEAMLAARYAPIELNSFPRWLVALVDRHPTVVEQTLGNELSWEMNLSSEEDGPSGLLSDIENAPDQIVKLFLPRLVAWFEAGGDQSFDLENAGRMSERVRRAIRVILRCGDHATISKLQEWTLQRLDQRLPCALHLVWLATLLRIDPHAGVSALEAQLADIDPSERSKAVIWLANLFGDRQDAVNLTDKGFTPSLLLKLLRLAYWHVRIADDVQHEGAYTPDLRDDAERARNYIVNTLLDAKGDEGLAAKLEMAVDPLCEHFKDRIFAVAAENWAQEIDCDEFDEAQAIELDKKGEAPASTNEAMLAIVKDRLSDIDDLLQSDASPREHWSEISQEKIMRRAVARELNLASNSLYIVDQEAVTADEKETDIRLRSTVSEHEAVIELKLGDKRSARDLLDTIENQLVKKYLAPENRRSGVLLVTLSQDRTWDHPNEKRRVDVDELVSLLGTEAERVEEMLGGTVGLAVHLLDLRPRLPLEKSGKIARD